MADPGVTSNGMVRLDGLESAREVVASLTEGAVPEGSFSAARTLAHCAESIEYSLTGFPALRSRAFRATVGRIALRKFLKQGYLSHDLGAPIPGVPDAAVESFDSAKARLLEAIARFLAHSGPFAPHFAYGPLTKDEASRVHAMHIADHLSVRRGKPRRP